MGKGATKGGRGLEEAPKARFRRDLLCIFVATLLLRMAVTLWGVASGQPGKTPRHGLDRWHRWDAEAYITVADEGYDSPKVSDERKAFNSRFPPLYPWLLRILSRRLGSSTIAAAIALSTLLFAMASSMLYALLLAEFGSIATARSAVLLLNFFPTAYFANTAYSESLFLLLLTAYLYLLVVRRSFRLAAVVAALVPLTRMVGIFLAPTHLIAFIRQGRSKGYRLVDALFLFLPLVPVCVFVYVQTRVFGHPGYLAVRSDTGQLENLLTLVPFQATALRIVGILGQPSRLCDPFFWNTAVWPSVFKLTMVVVLAMNLKRLPWHHLVTGGCYLLPSIFLLYDVSTPRFALCFLPLLIAAALVKSRRTFWVIALVFLALQLHFARTFASGLWAF